MNCVQNRADVDAMPDVARQRDTQAAAIGRTVDSRDHGLPQPVNPRGEVGDAFLPPHARPRELQPGARVVRIGVRQVKTRAESAPGAGEHDDPAVVVRARFRR